jgi:hypothetical protein
VKRRSPSSRVALSDSMTAAWGSAGGASTRWPWRAFKA